MNGHTNGRAESLCLLDHRGLPIEPKGQEPKLDAKSVFGMVNSYVQALYTTRLPAKFRAADPFSNSVWVFVAAMTSARAIGQAPFMVFRETEDTVRTRREREQALGRTWLAAPSGKARRAHLRYITKRTQERVHLRGIEPDLNHPLQALFEEPNPYQSGLQLFKYTLLWFHVRGEVFWVKTDAQGMPGSKSGNPPERLWPIGPDCFEPILSNGTVGELVGWKFTPPKWMPGFKANMRVGLDLEDVIQFKDPNPRDPLRGMSRLTAIAQGIETDLLSRSYEQNLLANQSVPKGVLTHDGDLPKEKRDEFLRQWREEFEGPDNAGRTALLANGFKYDALGLSPVDLNFLEARRMSREEILAVMSTPPSIVGLTDVTNYATGLAQKKEYWEGHVVPSMREIECEIDKGLFADEGDNVFGMFDLRNVDALRAGVEHKINIADKMCGQNLHVSPRVAFEVVDLEVPDYDGDDQALVGALATPFDELGNTGDIGEPAPPAEDDPNADPAAEDPAPKPSDEKPAAAASLRMRGRAWTKATKASRWRAFVKLEAKFESRGRTAYKTWIAAQRAQTLKSFDLATDKKSAGAVLREQTIDLTAVLPKLKAIQDSLKAGVRPTYARALEGIYKFTVEELGTPVFEIDDEQIMSWFDLRERKMLAESPARLLRNLRSTLVEGIGQSETIAQLRHRIASVFDVSASSSKTLTWARTEVGGLMNGTRNVMFELQGVQEVNWVNAGDEAVRADHLSFGEAGTKPFGFNWLEVIDRGDGVLSYPGDVRGPVDQIVNCRCLQVVVG